jgi:hypothetical protein
MTHGDRSERATPRRGRLGASLLAAAAVGLAIGCQTVSRPIPENDRRLDPPPFAKTLGGARDEDAQDKDKDQDKDQHKDKGQAQPKDCTPGETAGAGADSDSDSEPATWPNIRDPGPDMANFPNSAFTIPRGAVHIELAPLTLAGATDSNAANYTTQFLLRYGLTEHFELRVFGPGFTKLSPPQKTTAFAPPAIDMKANLWGESENHLIPATGLEVYIVTEWGSPALRSGMQAAMSLLFDHTLPLGINFEWNVGFNGAQKPLFVKDNSPNGPYNTYHGVETNAWEWNLQWALQRRFFKKLDVFTHGFLNTSAIPSLGDGVVVGGGAVWLPTERLALFTSLNGGLNKDAPPTFFLLGFAYAL